jgi:hypothetical protein
MVGLVLFLHPQLAAGVSGTLGTSLTAIAFAALLGYAAMRMKSLKVSSIPDAARTVVFLGLAVGAVFYASTVVGMSIPFVNSGLASTLGAFGIILSIAAYKRE